jgi:hypothetical protein
MPGGDLLVLVDLMAAGGDLPLMRRTFRFTACLLVALPVQATAQTTYYLTIGAVAATDLVRDQIIAPIKVRQSIAPSVVAGAALTAFPRYRAGLELEFASGGFHATENGGATNLGRVSTLAATLGLDGPVFSRMRWRVGTGLIHYMPSDQQGIFLGGSTTRWLVGLGTEYRYRLKPERWDLLGVLRYDIHPFLTHELERRGFSQARYVHRLTLSVGIARAAQ